MALVPPWPVVGTLGAGLANLALLRYVWRWRDRPGGRWFAVVIAVQAAWCFVYGAALLTFDPTLREALELLSWLPFNWIGVCFLAFALEYTGRVDLLRSPVFGGAVAFEVLSTALVLTNPLHGLVWSEFQVVTTAGAAAAAYVHGPWVFLQYAAVFVQATLGIVVLLDTVVSYGPVFRKQAFALALTPFPPAAACTLWVLGVGPWPALNLTPLMFLPHAVLDVYALFREEMFEFPPTTRRTGERAAIDDLATAVVIVDLEGRVVTLNAAARELFGVDKRAVQTAPLSSLYDGDPVELSGGTQSVEVRTAGQRRAFNVRATPLRDAADTEVGHTVTFEDVTEERRRKQRLSVLNRILRHNLRNDLTVVRSYAEVIEDEDDGAFAEYAATIGEQSTGLLELAEKARRAADALDGEGEHRDLPVRELIEEVVADLDGDGGQAASATDGGAPAGADRVRIDVPPDLRVRSDPRLLELMFRSLLENALQHTDDPEVEVAYVGNDDGGHSAVLEVRDDGPGVPEHELAVLGAGEESALEHGSGLGLWLVRWGATALGGDVTFETAPGEGTTAVVRVPGLLEAPG